MPFSEVRSVLPNYFMNLNLHLTHAPFPVNLAILFVVKPSYFNEFVYCSLAFLHLTRINII